MIVNEKNLLLSMPRREKIWMSSSARLQVARLLSHPFPACATLPRSDSNFARCFILVEHTQKLERQLEAFKSESKEPELVRCLDEVRERLNNSEQSISKLEEDHAEELDRTLDAVVTDMGNNHAKSLDAIALTVSDMV